MSSKAAHLVGVVEAVEHEPFAQRSNQNELLAAAGRKAPHRDDPHLVHRLVEELISLLAPLVGTQEVRLLEVDGVHCLHWNERLDLDGAVTLGLELFQLILGHHHVLATRILVTLYELAALDLFAGGGVYVLLLHSGVVRRIQHVETHRLRTSGGVELHRDRDEAETDGSRSRCARCHRVSPERSPSPEPAAERRLDGLNG